MFILGSGGHTTRALLLSKQLNYDKYYIVPWESEITKLKVKDKYFSVISPRYRAKSNKSLTIIRTLFLFIHSLCILLYVRPKMVISTGSGISLPILLIARLFRVKSVYIESPSRVFEPSITGRMLLGKTTKWLSSWKELSEKYKGIEYGGIIN
jgi:beta-1,4-N-acetylglucosaminyltransferase